MEVEHDGAVNAGGDPPLMTDLSGHAPSNPYGRFGKTVKGATTKLLRARTDKGAWSWGMSALALAGVAAVFLAHFFDSATIVWERAGGSPLMSWIGELSPAGKFQWYMIPALAGLVCAACADWPARNRRGRGRLSLVYAQSAFALSTLFITFLSNNLLKIVIGRGRPRLFEEHGAAHFQPMTAGYDFASFPSGHATACGTVAAILIIWFPRWSVPVLLVFSAVAISRIAVGAHYPSDVAAGFAIGFVVTLFIARWLAARRLGFRLPPGRLLPRLRHAQAMRAASAR
jgi:undecaprenyl-diphosphatase